MMKNRAAADEELPMKETPFDRAESPASESLRFSEERFRVLLESGPGAVYSCDASGVIQEFTRCAAELWGRPPQPGDTDERFGGWSRKLCADRTGSAAVR